MASSSCSSEVSNRPQLPWKYRVMLRFAPLFFHIAFRSDSTVNRRLLQFVDRKAPASSEPLDGISSSDLTIDTSRSLWIRIYTPTAHGGDSPKLPVVLFFHGGGFALFHADTLACDVAARRYAGELRAVVISVNYRLAPEFRFPSPYDDGFDALKFLDEIDDGVLPAAADLGRCFILGESAGGNLGHHVAVRASEYASKKVTVAGFVAVQPFFGGEERTKSEIRLCNQPPFTREMADWFWKAFLPVGSDRDHAAANVFGPKGEDISRRKFPATLILVGGFDLLCDRQRMYEEWLKRSGKKVELVEFSNAIHGFSGLPDLPEYSSMIREMKNFMERAPKF
ncbi:probable carboxylesterase 18 [Momordica charantia]|uniref:Probable carboxylesterase 18 n=1 Tax=Momordica charantia TaxID=3673 RepID=A0A6J1DY15_MOMCH|nr:probable carboxylesterase 18 [Momordica charantia]